MNNKISLVLASGSPRRKELLTQLGYRFDIVLSDIKEEQQDNETAYDYVLRLSLEKAQAGLAMSSFDAVVLGSDTVVVCDGFILEKPNDFEHSKRMLNQLSGRHHQVMTAVSVVSAEQQYSQVVVTDVWFKSLTDEEIEQYWQSGEPCDKAGSYGIQGLGGRFVTRIEGSYYAVVGLPLFETDQLIQEFL
ncbi:Maf family protein [Vibrio sagamiensis]|uniref:dTTP/UTP pyrophosphatase n=1 Tax=Vibrio sagamiensis NBRC 104589 TaxID=1219064 RepID=A0A511QF78_9VIBR|nr:Maf family protein [Vibrio sagamiensis]PNQ71224.1 septum formation inhibitor Maf [Vibrio agarivorans]GEM75955.1 Maf-like protein [Vibrio sagamiensis NBRC 104589]